MTSSSRWKRFAFFDRKNLSLPSSVWEDVSADKHGQADLSFAVTPHACILTEQPAPDFSSPSSAILSSSSSLEDSDIQRSLVQITSSLEGMVRSLTQSRDEGIPHTHSSNSSTENDVLVFHGGNRVTSSKSSYDGYICLAFLSSTSTSVVHCIDLTWRCFTKQ